MIRAPSKNGVATRDSYKEVRRGFLDTIASNAAKRKNADISDEAV
jgi:hypothetical protein